MIVIMMLMLTMAMLATLTGDGDRDDDKLSKQSRICSSIPVFFVRQVV
jgi:hypothetical protein